MIYPFARAVNFGGFFIKIAVSACQNLSLGVLFPLAQVFGIQTL
jgi:hypothetical protein